MKGNVALDNLDDINEFESHDPDKMDFGDDVGGDTGVSTAETDAPKAEKPVESAASSTSSEPEAVSEADEKPAPGFLPRHRYNVVRDRWKESEAQRAELEERLAEMERQLAETQQQRQQSQSKPQDDGPTASQVEARIDFLDAKIEEARADGDNTLANQLRREQRFLERHLAKMEITQDVQPAQQERIDPTEVTRQAVEQLRTETLVAQLEAAFPQLDSENEAFDEVLSDEVMGLFDTFVQTMSPSVALQRAVQYVLPAHGISPDAQAAIKQRRATNFKKNIEAASKIPPDLGAAGYDSNKAGINRAVDVMKMDQDDFEKLGDKEIEKLLGNDDI